MTEVGLNHCQIVSASIAGERAVNEQTFASLAILTERLERIRKLGQAFYKVEFSPDVEKLKSRKNPLPVG